jgi:hypothetical protein
MVETIKHGWNQSETDWPDEVRFIISMLQGHDPHFKEGRERPRAQYRVKAALEIEDASGITQTVPIYTRDVNAFSLGFVLRTGLKVGSRARFIRAGCSESHRAIPCVLDRCRPFIEGWYEGAVLFDMEQSAFEP